jgi:hypothetical protein
MGDPGGVAQNPTVRHFTRHRSPQLEEVIDNSNTQWVMRGIVAFLLVLVSVCVAHVLEDMQVTRAWEEVFEMREEEESEIEMPSSMPTGIPSSMPSSEPTGIPTLAPSTSEIDIIVGVEQTLTGFPSATVWETNPELDVAYRTAIATRLNIALDFVDNTIASNDYTVLSGVRRLQAITGITVACNVSIPNFPQGTSPTEAADEIFTAITATLPTSDDDAATSQSFLDLFVVEVQLLSTSNGGSLNPSIITDNVLVVTSIETAEIEIVNAAISFSPTPGPTATPGNGGGGAPADMTGVLVGVPLGGLALIGVGVWYYLKTQMDVMPVKKIMEGDVTGKSIVPVAGV